ncbi:MAG TPA: hypothetical protein VGV34_08515, partial [Solirubrobacterales bacterium]|nr:hypothetical protein [Solirubrobacterales bacterium]
MASESRWVSWGVGIAAAAVVWLSFCSGPLDTPPVEGTAQAALTDPVREGDPVASRKEVENLETRIEDQGQTYDRIFYVLAFLVAVLTGGGFIGVILSLRTEQRQGEIHRLGIAGETKAQERAEETHRRAEETHNKLLAGSEETLNLVNATLSLAKDASKRAEDAVRGKAVERLRDLDQEAEKILDAVHHADNFKYVVRDAGTEEQLRGIAERFRA